MQSKIIVFDLFGVMILLKKRIILFQLGLWNIIKFFIVYRTNPLDHCLMLLNMMRLHAKDEFQDVVRYNDFYLPNSLCLWQKGLISNQQALERVASYIETLPDSLCYDKKLMLIIVHTIFSTPALMKAIYLNMPFYNQIVALKKTHPIYLLSNIDKQSWHSIQTKYPQLSSLIDGAVISGQYHLLKPDPALFKILKSAYNLPLTQCLFIDDQHDNCIAAKKLGMQTITYTTQSNIVDILTQH